MSRRNLLRELRGFALAVVYALLGLVVFAIVGAALLYLLEVMRWD